MPRPGTQHSDDDPVQIPNPGPGATKDELLQAMEGHVLDTAELVGTHKR